MVLWLSIALALASPPWVGSPADLGGPRAPTLPVVGGTPSSAGDWPELVALHTDVGFGCSGIQIDASWVLTAGHCAPGLIEAQIGATDAGDPTDGLWIPILEVIPHEAFLDTYDVALVRLEEPSAEPSLQLALDCDAEHTLRDGEPVILVGYGATDTAGQGTDRTLHEATTWIDDHDCSSLYRGCNAAIAPGGEFLAGGQGVDTCTGDSGGPALMEGSSGTLLVGITSRAALPAKVTCGDGGIFVRVDAIATWLEENDVPIDRPNCDGANRSPRPDPTRLTLPAGASAKVVIDPRDPNPQDTHSFRVTARPALGEVQTTAAGDLSYEAPSDARGQTTFTVDITDDGDPPLTGTTRVTVTITEPKPDPHGCGGGTHAWLLLAPWFGRSRRRTSRPGRSLPSAPLS